jgi:transposase
MKPYSLDLRQQILRAYKNKEGSMLKIACKFHVSRSFVQKLIKQERETGSVAPLKSVVRCESKLLPHINIIEQLIHKHLQITLKQLCQAIELTTETTISQSAMCQFLQDHQLSNS